MDLRPALLLAAAGLAALPGHAIAQVEASGEAALVSDYRYRGVSLSGDRPALQASIEAESGGLYVGAFGSWAQGGQKSARTELDGMLGYRRALGQRLTVDAGLAWYHYPGAPDCDYGEATLALGRERGGTALRAGISYAPPQRALLDASGRRWGNVYGFAGLDQTITGTPLSIGLRAGYESGPFDGSARGGKLDWSASVTATRGRFRLSGSYVGAARANAVGGRRSERALLLTLGLGL